MGDAARKILGRFGHLLLFYVLLALSAGCSSNGQELNIMVPAYFQPDSNPGPWAALNAAAAALPNRVVAVANVDTGPGTAAQASYTSAIAALHDSTGRVIGYVHTSYGSRALADVEADVDAWYAFYPDLDGIFFDEAANNDDDGGKEAYYQALYGYVKAKQAAGLVVNNPGTPTLESYLFFNGSRVTDVVCTFESGVGALQWTQATWTSSYDRSNFLGLFYNVTDINVSSFDYGDVIDRAYQQNAGWVYVTDDSLPNPWDTLPAYFSNEVSYIEQENYL